MSDNQRMELLSLDIGMSVSVTRVEAAKLSDNIRTYFMNPYDLVLPQIINKLDDFANYKIKLSVFFISEIQFNIFKMCTLC